MTISDAELPGKRVRALDLTLAYVEIGAGDPILFLHGNPTSSYLWRNIMPVLASQERCLAPDLPGMGGSDKLPEPGPGKYRFLDHYRYLCAALDGLDLGRRVTLVLHDWGSALGFHWAREHADRVLGIAYMEAIVRPLSWQEWPEASRGLFQALRSPKGEELVLQKNIFVERILPGSVLRKLTETEMAVYRRPYGLALDRWPTLAWPRELPIDGQPADVTAVVSDYSRWMAENDIPKLFINAEPGAILTGAPRAFCRSWKNQTEITVRGVHFIQEDSPAEIAAALVDWYDCLDR